MYNKSMIKRVLEKHDLKNFSETRQNLEYWLSRPADERIAAVDYLRRQIYGDTIRLQRVVKVIHLKQKSTRKKKGHSEP